MDMVMNHTLRQAQVVPGVALVAQQSLPRLVYVARRKRRDGYRQRPTAEQLAVGFWALGVGVGREDAPVLLPQVLYSAA